MRSTLWRNVQARFRALNAAAAKIDAPIVGVMSLIMAGGIAFLFVSISTLVAASPDDLEIRLTRILALAAVFSIPILFGSYVGYRLVTNRPSRNGTSLPSYVWALAGVFLALCDGLAVFVAGPELLKTGGPTWHSEGSLCLLLRALGWPTSRARGAVAPTIDL